MFNLLRILFEDLLAPPPAPTGWNYCKYCGGTGVGPGGALFPHCPVCNGHGIVPEG